MTISTAKRTLTLAAFAVALVVSPAIYAIAQPEGSARGSAGRMSRGCDGMMAGNMMGRAMMGDNMMRGGMMGEGTMGGGGMMGSGKPTTA